MLLKKYNIINVLTSCPGESRRTPKNLDRKPDKITSTTTFSGRHFLYDVNIYIAPSPSQRSLVSTSSPGSPRTNGARASAWLLRTGFQKQFLSNFGEGKFDFVVFRSPHHGCFRQTSELARFKKEGNQCSLYRARQQREDNHNQ